MLGNTYRKLSETEPVLFEDRDALNSPINPFWDILGTRKTMTNRRLKLLNQGRWFFFPTRSLSSSTTGIAIRSSARPSPGWADHPGWHRWYSWRCPDGSTKGGRTQGPDPTYHNLGPAGYRWRWASRFPGRSLRTRADGRGLRCVFGKVGRIFFWKTMERWSKLTK